MAKKQTRRGVARNAQAPKRKAVAKKPALTKQKRAVGTGLAPARNRMTTRRPDVNGSMSAAKVIQLTNNLASIKEAIEDYAAHMRALDRRRLNGVGVKKQGFIESSYEAAVTDPEFLPHWISLEKFAEDIAYFRAMKNLLELSRQISELMLNLVMQSSDMAYTDALEYYASVREAAKRRVDAAETVFNELKNFFKSRGHNQSDQPTENEIRRDINALLRGRKDGKIVVENFNPKAVKGSRKLIDKTFKNKIAYKNTEESEEND